MTVEERKKVCKSPMVFRGEVHRYHNLSGWSGYCVIVSGNHRAKDAYVSVVSLTDAEKDTVFCGDEIVIEFPSGKEYFCHCGMITYVRRDRIDDLILKIDRETMRKVDLAIMQEMGIEGVLD